ncbi:hypothetical protein [uncultured Zhongshania sp.]|uniref:hypothetical protein n=1 Tax=uncultured Zhongshania sp. TaxID=1642288 RepID=UPI0030D6EFF7|tara:strand:- start:8047 stop:8832 length:786 start_codon:yes stop_codon:yes gene_type:complete
MPLPTPKAYTVARYADEMGTTVSHVVELFYEEALNFAVSSRHFPPKSICSAVVINQDDQYSDRRIPIPEYCYINSASNPLCIVSEGESNIKVDRFLDFESGSEFGILINGEEQEVAINFSDLRVTQEEIERGVLGANIVLPQLSKNNALPDRNLFAGGEQGDEVSAEVSPKSRNSYLRLIAALSEALIDGSGGSRSKDADAVLLTLENFYLDKLRTIPAERQKEFSFRSPIGQRALVNYLTEAAKLSLEYDFLDFREYLPK